MSRSLKRIAAVLGASVLTLSATGAPSLAAADGWRSGAGVRTGETGHHGIAVGPDGTNYLCAADGNATAVSAASVTSGSMSAPAEVSSLTATPFIYRSQDFREVEVTDPATLAQISWVASNASTTDDVDASASQIALIRLAGVFQGSVYEAQEQGHFPWGNGDNLNAPLTASVPIVDMAKKYAGPYTVAPSLALSEDATGTISNIGVTSASGTSVPGRPFTVDITGPAVFASDGTQSMTGTTGDSLTSADLKLTGNGKVSVTVRVSDLATSKPWISTGTVVKNGKESRAQNLIVIGKKTKAEGTAEATSNLEFGPEVSTQVANKVISKGDSLVDSVTVKADSWRNIPGTQQSLPIKVKVDVYGPFSAPQPQTADGSSFASKHLGAYELEFTAAGTQETADTIKAPAEGFYFFQARVLKDMQGNNKDFVKAYESPFFEASETTVAPWTPSIKTKATQVDLGNGAAGVKDIVIVSGFPEDHGDFNGLGEWKADVKTIEHSIYFVPKSTPLTEGVTKDLTPLATVTTPAKNGEYTIDASDFKIDWDLGVGTYVIVSNFAGDSRAGAVATSDLDTDEHVVPTFGKVRTTAFSEKGGKLVPGDKIGDKVTLEGSFPKGSYTEVNLYSWKKGTAPTCTTPVWTADRIKHDGVAGEYITNMFTTDSRASDMTYGFVETTYDKNGNVISTGTCGDETETLSVGRVIPPKPELPKTGSNVAGLGWAALGLLLAGVGFIVIKRRNS